MKKNLIAVIYQAAQTVFNLKELAILLEEKNFDNLKAAVHYYVKKNMIIQVRQYLGVPILVMKKEYMDANKLVALTERVGMANRDIFDIYFFLKEGWGINANIVELRTGMKLKEYIPKCIVYREDGRPEIYFTWNG